MFIKFCQLYKTNPAFMEAAEHQLMQPQSATTIQFTNDHSEDGRLTTPSSLKNYSAPGEALKGNWSNESVEQVLVKDGSKSRHAKSLKN